VCRAKRNRQGSGQAVLPKALGMRLAKMELKKMCVGGNEKYRRFGNECWLTCCPFEIWSVCWPPVKMVFTLLIRLCFSRLFAFALLSFRLVYDGPALSNGRDFKGKISIRSAMSKSSKNLQVKISYPAV